MKKKRIFDIIQIGNTEDLPSRAFDWFLVIVIVLNILVMFLATFDTFLPLTPVFTVIEYVSAGVFCIEYILRIWTADLLYPDETPFRARLHFLRSYDGVVDLLTILPFVMLDGFVVFRMLRVVRIFHLFRHGARAGVLPAGTAAAFSLLQKDTALLVPFACLTSPTIEEHTQGEQNLQSLRTAASTVCHWASSVGLPEGNASG